MPIRTLKILSFLGASLALGTIASAQNAMTKAPTAADWAAMAKLPDFNGVWEVGTGRWRWWTRAGGAAGGAGAGGGAATVEPPLLVAQHQMEPQRIGRGRGGGGRGGRGRLRAGPSLTPAYAAKAAAMARQSADGPTANCLPPGLPGIMSQPYPLEFLLTPGKVTIISEAYTQVRHIYTDGRPLPADPDPTFYGTSIGHWDDDTLVVESVGFEDVPRGHQLPA